MLITGRLGRLTFLTQHVQLHLTVDMRSMLNAGFNNRRVKSQATASMHSLSIWLQHIVRSRAI